MKKICLIIALLVLASLPLSNLFAGNGLPGIPLLLLSGGIQVPDGAVLSAGGQIWMDRNLGASRIAISSADTEAYGDLYQWGRLTDGHEKRGTFTWGNSSTSDNPGHGLFIVGHADWRSPSNNSLWQGVSGKNNPCPAGFRLPTEEEWGIERASWSSNDAAGAFASPLKLVVGGYRYHLNGDPSYVGDNGHYWSSTVGSSTQARYLSFTSTGTTIYGKYRATGYSVRCIMD